MMKMKLWKFKFGISHWPWDFPGPILAASVFYVLLAVAGLARILHEQCEVEVFWVWSDKPGLQGLHGVHDRLFRYDWADFGRTSPNPRCLSTCRGSTRRGSGGVQANGHHTEQLLVRTGTA